MTCVVRICKDSGPFEPRTSRAQTTQPFRNLSPHSLTTSLVEVSDWRLSRKVRDWEEVLKYLRVATPSSAFADLGNGEVW